jgi:hypothetical protein
MEMELELESIILDATNTIKELQAANEKLSRLLYEERREHRNDQDVASETIERLHDQIAALS